MTTVLDLLPEHARDDANAIEGRIVAAYKAFKNGHASKDDAAIILNDLAIESGYFEVLPADATGDQVLQHNGARRVYGRIMFALNLPQARLDELMTSVLASPVETQG